MSRYRSGPNFYDGYEAHTADTYHETDRNTWTGLYDHNGVPLHRQPEPIGYDPHRWRTTMPDSPNKKKTYKTKKKGK